MRTSSSRPIATSAAAVIAAAAALVMMPARADDAARLQPFQAAGDTPPPPWKVAGLPRQTKPFTRFALAEHAGRRALRVEADNSYGNLVHPLKTEAAGLKLAWSWQVETLIDAVDLNTRAGDDTALKVCVFFDMPIERVPFVERQLLRAAGNGGNGEPLPAATVCYVWDAHLPTGTALPNAFTGRMRYIVLQSGPAKAGQWASERRDVTADFKRLFGDESAEVPPISGVAVGADADNTHGKSLGFVADLKLGR